MAHVLFATATHVPNTLNQTLQSIVTCENQMDVIGKALVPALVVLADQLDTVSEQQTISYYHNWNKIMKQSIREKQEQKLRDVKSRKLERSKRSNKQQITLLDHRLGEGVGAVKERKRLTKST